MKKCSCVKDELRKQCSSVTCRYCPCFDPNQRVNTENVGRDALEDIDMEDIDDILQSDEDMNEFDSGEDNLSISSISSGKSSSDEEFIPFTFDRDDCENIMD